MDEALEKAIDEAGRDRVLTRAESYGWRAGDAPPKYVWWGIVQELREGQPPPYKTGSVLGFNLLGL